MNKLPPIKKRKTMERIGLWLQDEASYKRYVHKVNEFNYKIFVGQINHNNSYLGYIFNILLYYRFGKRYMDTEEKFYQFIELNNRFKKTPYTIVMDMYRYYSDKGIIPYVVHNEIQETLQWLVEPYDRAYDEFDEFNAGPYWRKGKEWINNYYDRLKQQ